MHRLFMMIHKVAVTLKTSTHFHKIPGPFGLGAVVETQVYAFEQAMGGAPEA